VDIVVLESLGECLDIGVVNGNNWDAKLGLKSRIGL